ncbi:MAG: DUF1573 domain-containing protein [Phycisphaerae bacterium]
METLIGRREGERIPFSALFVAAILLAGIAASAIFSVFGSENSTRLSREVRPHNTAFYSADFGRFGPQEHPTLDFTLTNRTDRAIRIEGVIPSCSCITAGCSHRNVAPGAAATVAVTYRGFPGVFGPFGKSVAVTYHESPTGPQRVLRLFVRGDAVCDAPLRAYPQNVYLGNAAPGAKVISHLYFHGWMGLLRSLPASIRLSPGHRYRLALRQTDHSRATRDKAVELILQVPVAQPAGRFSCIISLTGPAVGRVRIRVEGYISICRSAALAGNPTRASSKAAQLVPAVTAK